MRPTMSVAVVRAIAAAVFIGGAGLLVQSFAEGEQNAAPSPAGEISAAKAMAAAGEPAFPDFLVAPVKVRTVEVPVPGDEPSIPVATDPRWAKTDHGGPAVVTPPIEAELAEHAPALASLQEHEAGGAGLSMVTGSTSGTLEMEIARQDDTREHVSIDSAVLEAAKKDFARADVPAKTTRITSDVRLRSRGSNASQVIGVIPGGATVGVVRCGAWCEVTHEGKRGWVYSGFVSGYERRRPVVRAAPAPQQEATEAVAEAKPKRRSWASRLFGNPVEAPQTGARD